MKLKIASIGLSLALLATSGGVLAQGNAGREAALMLRILSYDGTLRSRAKGGVVTVLVLYKRGHGASEAARSAVRNALNSIGKRTTVANMNARAAEHPWSDAGALIRAGRSTGAVAVYVCPGLEGEVGAISRAARGAHLLTMTPDEGSVRRGLSVGLVGSGSRIKLLINLSSVRAEGARLDAAVLRLAEVIR